MSLISSMAQKSGERRSERLQKMKKDHNGDADADD